MKKFLLIIGTSLFLSSCSLFHSSPPFEMERMAEDVLTSKSGNGIKITIEPIKE